MKYLPQDLFRKRISRYFLVPGVLILSSLLLNAGCKGGSSGEAEAGTTDSDIINPIDQKIADPVALGITIPIDLGVYNVSHIFSVNDIQGGFDGVTFADDDTIVCVNDDCASKTIKGGQSLRPIDSEFGFLLTDFSGGEEKTRNNDYKEGWAANIVSDEYGSGLMVANAKTGVFKAPKLTGTWCSGMGGKLVKCSTEHYVNMEQVLTCYESVPFSQDILDTQQQKYLTDPDTGEQLRSCSHEQLDNELYIIENGNPTENRLTSVIPLPAPGGQMVANESTVLDDIAVSDSYSVTLKDDGKPLYRWGNAVKRPNDIRLYARMALPDEWKEPGAEFNITRAYLVVHHQITNNPNDQLRPEDMENEGATGRVPEYAVDGEKWLSTRDCYKGDGEHIPAGTLFKTGDTEFIKASRFSSDLIDGFTVAWYTSIHRDPFEPGNNIGPRWRLKSNKFGQDLPSFEIPKAECTPPPYQGKSAKYESGVDTTTVINLLDIDEGIVSPLRSSFGWINAEENSVNISSKKYPGVSVNGLPLTEDFDLAVYVKGDAKGTRLYNATLVLDYEKIETDEPEEFEESTGEAS